MLRKDMASALPLTGILLNRFETERKRSGFVAERLNPAFHPHAAVMSMKLDGVSILVRDGMQWLHPVRHEGTSLVNLEATRAVYIGENKPAGLNVFVADASDAADVLVRQGTWASPRHLMHTLDTTAAASENALLSLCLSTYQWVQTTRFCARCGGSMEPRNGGSSLKCSHCSTAVYPSVSPAIIVAVLDGKGQVLLCQRRRRASSSVDGKVMRTVLSGFVSQGESMEETVIREVEEESQAKVMSVRYVGSQPWPLPHELMCAYYAVAPASGVVVPQEGELLSVAWVSREELQQAMAGTHPSFTVPPAYTVAHYLLKAWADGAVDDNGLPTC